MHQGGPLKGVQPPALGTGGARVDDVIDSLEDVDSANLLALTLVILCIAACHRPPTPTLIYAADPSLIRTLWVALSEYIIVEQSHFHNLGGRELLLQAWY